MVRHYQNPPSKTIDAILSMLFDQGNYSAQLVALYPSYSIFAQEVIKADIKTIDRDLTKSPDFDHGGKVKEITYQLLDKYPSD